ncbi:hypothetical protein VTI28DRAFT_4727 [Corynascus sepedonium]
MQFDLFPCQIDYAGLGVLALDSSFSVRVVGFRTFPENAQSRRFRRKRERGALGSIEAGVEAELELQDARGRGRFIWHGAGRSELGCRPWFYGLNYHQDC